MSTPCSQSLRPKRCVVSEYEVSYFLGSRERDIFSGPPCIKLWFEKGEDPIHFLILDLKNYSQENL